MPSVSKIPKNVNQYAIKYARKICQAPIEYGMGIDFNVDKITRISDVVEGTAKYVKYDHKYSPKDIFIHNHPAGSSISLEDIYISMHNGTKKIFASTKIGFTAIDLTKLKKSLSKDEMLNWLKIAIIERNIKKTRLEQEYNRIPIQNRNNNFKEYNDMFSTFHDELLKKFAKYSGATFSKVKWSDYKKLKK